MQIAEGLKEWMANHEDKELIENDIVELFTEGEVTENKLKWLEEKSDPTFAKVQDDWGSTAAH